MAEMEDLRGRALYDALMSIKPEGLAETDWAVRAGVNRGFFTNLKNQPISPRSDTLRKLLREVGRSEADLYAPSEARTAGKHPEDHGPSTGDVHTVGIQHIDLAFGLGATFADSPVEVEVLQFPQQWVETITLSPAELLTWTRGRGDSMLPTIDDGDLVLLDRSQREVKEQDAIWAYTIGDIAAIKRLRVKGDRYQIFSDNPAVAPDEEPIDFVNIVARVVFVGKRL
ncbi:S24 family peptidase [Sphingomonas sp. 3-13AW]|uniref:S24 family peptidase n=1 Tax=Sphingomonas sp. 3-13AW TaxID=3050450 RepID=UPI003BB721A9